MSTPPRVHFATTEDGLRIACTAVGEGYPLVWVPHFLASHVQLEWDFPQRYVYSVLSQHLRIVRFDSRGLGLSDRDVPDISLASRITDLEAVARRFEFDRFALLGIEGGGNLAAGFAAAHPDMVSHLLLVNWTPHFSDQQSPRLQSLSTLMRTDWELFTENIGASSFGFDTPLAAGYARLVRSTVSPEMATRYGAQLAEEDLMVALDQISCQAFVLHSQKNTYSNEDAARTTAASIPNASLEVFEGGLADHITEMLEAIQSFVAPEASVAVAAPTPSPGPQIPSDFTSREVEILVLLANGLSNREMAEQLVLSPRTVERHLENLYRKAGFRNRAEATAFAYTSRLVERD